MAFVFALTPLTKICSTMPTNNRWAIPEYWSFTQGSIILKQLFFKNVTFYVNKKQVNEMKNNLISWGMKNTKLSTNSFVCFLLISGGGIKIRELRQSALDVFCRIVASLATMLYQAIMPILPLNLMKNCENTSL